MRIDARARVKTRQKLGGGELPQGERLEHPDGGLGGVLAVLGQADRPVSYLTTGQAVPDDIEPADRRRLARLILGHEVVS